MNNKELADAIVASGVGERIDMRPPHSGTAWALFGDEIAFLTAESFVNDWRVAGAMLTRLRKAGFSILIACLPDGKCLVTISSPLPERKEWDAQVVDDDDARAINEAAVKALAK